MVDTKQTNMEIKKDKVNLLIEEGRKKGLTGKDVIDALVRKGFQPEGVDVNAIKQTFTQSQQPQQKTDSVGVVDRIKTGIQEKGAKIQEQIAGTGEYSGQSALERGVGATATGFSALSGTLYNALPEVARNTLDKVGGGIGKGINYLTDKISNNPALQEFAMSEAGKDTEKVSRVLSDLGIISGEILGADQATKALSKTAKAVQTGIETTSDALTTGTGNVLSKTENMLPKSPEIMNRVARLKPSDATKFEKMAGKTHGQYLTETGNFGTPDEIIAKEAQKFTQSLNSVDDTLSKLSGVYKDGSIADALKELGKKAVAESGDNIKAPYASRVQELTTKLGREGLSMSEINEVKRLFEKNVKLGYNKLTNAEKVAQATNIDSALRKWQVGQAEKLGFSNIADLNKQTQMSKFIIDKLGDQVVGQSGLNGVSLTDWIMLSGGDPTAVAGFLTKKFFSSKSVQAKIAKMLSDGEVKGQINADVKATPESIKRAVSPQGFEQLPAPKAGTPKSQVNVQINQPSRKAIEQGTEIVPKTSTKQPQSVLKIESKKALSKSLPKTKKMSTSDPLLQEAKKYKSAEEFVKAQRDTNIPIEKYLSDSKIDGIEKYGQYEKLGNRPINSYIRFDGGGEISFSLDKNKIIIEGLGAGNIKGKATQILEAFKKKAIRENKTLFARNTNVPGTPGSLSYWKSRGFISDNKGNAIFEPKSQLEEIWKKANKK